MLKPETAIAEADREHWRNYVVPQDWGHFNREEHDVWDILFARQVPIWHADRITLINGIATLRSMFREFPSLESSMRN